MTSPGTVILGAGFGGIAAAVELARLAPGHRVTLVDAGESFRMGLVALWALDGRTTGEEHARSLSRLKRLGIRVLRARATGIDPARRFVATDAGPVPYDQLLVALGADVAPGRVEGLPAAARNVYSVSGAAELRRDLAKLDGGRLLVVAHSMPFKCPPAPYEAAMLAKRQLVARGADVEVVLATPEPHPVPVFGPEVGARVKALVEARGVRVVNGAQLAGFPDARTAAFADGARIGFDALGLVPPHLPPAALAAIAGPAGWVDVDPATLATRHEGIWAVGDCTRLLLPNGKPIPKAGVLAEAEALVVARNLAATLRGEAPTARFDGRGTCWIEVGDGRAAEGSGEFFADPAPRMTFGEPSVAALRAKEAFMTDRLAAWFG